MKIVPRDVAFSSFIFQLQKRDLEANLKLRNKNEELAKVEEEIKKLEGHVTILNFDQLRREKEQLEKKKKELEYMVSRQSARHLRDFYFKIQCSQQRCCNSDFFSISCVINFV